MYELQLNIGYTFQDVKLLQQALTHRSFSANNNERLEFLGDAVLDLAVSHILYANYPNMPEGELSRIRSQVVCKDILAEVARTLNLSTYIRLGSGELKSGGRTKASILADAVESILGAIYLESGLEKAAQVAKEWLHKFILNYAKDKQKDHKTRLQEYLQNLRLATPNYYLEKVDGHAHEQCFTIKCTIATPIKIEKFASATTKKEAEQLCAQQILSVLNI
jgi:ribonuclease III